MKKYSFFFVPFFGNIIEWYELTMYVGLSSVIGKIFFQSKDDMNGLLLGFAIHGVAYIARPFGTIFFGYYGDRHGRLKALLISLLLMCFATVGIGLLSTPAEIGISATYLLIFFRLVQGFSVSGEISAAITFTCESAPKNYKGVFASLQNMAILLGGCLGIMTIAGLNKYFTPKEIEDFYWRLPFLVSIILGVVGLIVRLYSSETPEFVMSKKLGKLHKNPIFQVFKKHKMLLFVIVIMILPHAFVVNVFFLATKTVVTNLLDFEYDTMLNLKIVPILLCIAMISGYISEKFPIKHVFIGYTIIYSVLSFAGSLILLIADSSKIAIIGAIFHMILSGFTMGFVAITLYKAFDVSIRESGIGMSLSIAGLIFGGFGMVIVISLYKAFGAVSFIYLAGLCFIINIFVLYMMQKMKEFSR